MRVKNKMAAMMQERGIRNLSQLAKVSGMAHSVLIGMYDGKDCRLSSLVRLCDFFGCKLSDLVEYEPTDKKVS
jgi:DNA-binding Xre family transcriptional regulator